MHRAGEPVGGAVDTIEPMVVPGPLSWDPLPAPPRRPRWQRMAVVGMVLVPLTVAAAVVTLPYLSVAPGSAQGVDGLISVPRDKAFPPEGEVLLATVALQPVTPIEAVVGWLDRDVDVVPERRVIGTVPPEQFTRRNAEAIADSKQVAVVVAFRRLGFPVPEVGKGALVMGVEPGSPAEGKLAEGQVITAVDGQATPVSDRAVELIRARRPGQRVRLGLEGADGRTREEDVVLGRHPEREGGFLGVMLSTKEQRFDLPFEIGIDSGDIGGSSAGLAFTLGVLDTLTRGELTGGSTVAATGTIGLDGTVGDVGGVAQKTAAVRAAGADLFLVPPGEFADASSRAGDDLRVVKVANLDEALAALADIGGDLTALGPAAGGPQG